MPRIRSVKPEYFTHPNIVKLSIPARLLLISLWNQADDAGRLYDQPRRLCANAFGEEDRINPERLIQELANAGRIIRYEAENKRCILVYHFSKHQRIDHPSTSNIPAPLDEGSPTLPGILTEPSRGEGKGLEGKGEEQGGEGIVAPAPRPRQRDPVFEALCIGCGMDWHELPDRERAKVNAAAAQLSHLKPPPSYDEILRRSARWPEVMGDATKTPNGIATNWARLNGESRASPRMSSFEKVQNLAREVERGERNGAQTHEPARPVLPAGPG